MMETFKGRVVLAGMTEGVALVSRGGFNTYASFFTSIHKRSAKAVCADSDNPDLYGNNLAGAIICLPGTIGSTSGGAVWLRLAKWGITPKAMLFSKKIDPLAAGGLLVADIWGGKRVVTVDRLGDEFLNTVKSGDRIRVSAEGTVILLGPSLDLIELQIEGEMLMG